MPNTPRNVYRAIPGTAELYKAIDKDIRKEAQLQRDLEKELDNA